MTANAMAGDRERCLDAGMNDHVAKPIEPKILFEALVRWIPAGERESVPSTASHAERTVEQTALPESLNGIDMEIGLRRTGDNRALYGNLLKDFVRDHGNDHQTIVDALIGNDIEVAHRTAHTLKGVAGGIGALETYESAQKVETALKEDRSRVPEPLMEKLDRDLREVVEDLERKMKPWGPVDTKGKNAQPIHREKIIPLLDTLQVLAEEMDPDAEEEAEEISQLLHSHGSVHKELGAKLAEQMADLDFEDALETLAELRAAFGKTDSRLFYDSQEHLSGKKGGNYSGG